MCLSSSSLFTSRNTQKASSTYASCTRLSKYCPPCFSYLDVSYVAMCETHHLPPPARALGSQVDHTSNLIDKLLPEIGDARYINLSSHQQTQPLLCSEALRHRSCCARVTRYAWPLITHYDMDHLVVTSILYDMGFGHPLRGMGLSSSIATWTMLWLPITTWTMCVVRCCNLATRCGCTLHA